MLHTVPIGLACCNDYRTHICPDGQFLGNRLTAQGCTKRLPCCTIVANRGTNIRQLECCWTDLKEIVQNNVDIHQVAAIEFTRGVIEEALAQHASIGSPAEVPPEGVQLHVVLTGHSLGAWLAELCTLDLHTRNIQGIGAVSVVTFESPGSCSENL